MTRLPSMQEYAEALDQGRMDGLLKGLYPHVSLREATGRIRGLLRAMSDTFGSDTNRPVLLVRAPGRTELGGNHTDHNHGHVLAASIQLDILALVSPREDALVHITSDGFEHTFCVDISQTAIHEDEKGRSEAMIRGMSALLAQSGARVGGFDACLHSTVAEGAGLSSSAAFEVLIGDIHNQLYNNGELDPTRLAILARKTENDYFGKPCGLMDQLASARGGVLHIDFASVDNPACSELDEDFQSSGYRLCVVNTGSHADLTPEYAAIPNEMGEVATHCGVEFLGELDPAQFWARLPEMTGTISDRALLRALHFIGENARVHEQVLALSQRNMGTFLRLVRASGSSSWRMLQNVTPSCDHTYPGAEHCELAHCDPANQPLALALAITEGFLSGDGACRVHGGGFAGTLQAYIPENRFSEYVRLMEGLCLKEKTTGKDTGTNTVSVIPLFVSRRQPLLLPWEDE